ncbi:MAG: 3-dehydroquinate synthase [Anaerolineae bacterium]|jgi:3-dehydroquinate synthase
MYPGDSGNLILTGFMGTGKTSVGQEIAERSGCEFVDMDSRLEARTGLTISEIFARHGEGYFRDLEAALCRELAARSALVIATGGGALVPVSNLEILGASGPVVCLDADPEDILKRLAAASDRPLLDIDDRRQRILSLLEERAEAYQRIGIHVDTSGLSPTQVADRVLAIAQERPARTIPVRHPAGQYSIHLGIGTLDQAGDLIRAQGLTGPVALVTNTTVSALYAERITNSLETAGLPVAVCVVPDGEQHKTLETMQTMYDAFIAAGLDRGSPVVALGGGVIGDMAGLAAATYLRGVPLVQIPTTLLSMVDSSVGGKVAVDHPKGKNLIGAFKQPELVIIDPACLSTLPQEVFASGLAETVKAGIIGDRDLYAQIEAYGPAPLPWIIERAIRVKISVVEEDPYERGRRAVLNLGHTFGHALELLSDYSLSHGMAVGIGLLAAARLAVRMGECDPDLVPGLQQLLGRLDLPFAYQGYTPEQIWSAMATDKKRRRGQLRFVLPRAIGNVFVTDQVHRTDVLDVLASLQDAGARSR